MTILTDKALDYRTETVVIANGGTVSGAIDLQGLTLCGVILPSAFTGAAITFQVSDDNVTYQAAYNTSNNAMTMTVTQARTYMITPTDFAGVRYLKLVSGSAEGAERTIKLLTRVLQ